MISLPRIVQTQIFMKPSSLTKKEEIFSSIDHKGYKLCHNLSGVDYLHRLFHQQAFLLTQTFSEETRILPFLSPCFQSL